jgi:hypothetical protein
MIYLPTIIAEDYEAFRAILRQHIPYAYDKWLKLHAMSHHHYVSEGQAICNVHVNANQFARHLKRTGRAANMDELNIFAVRVVKGEAD